MLHFSQDVIVREMAGILDMAALGASEAPADLAFSLKGALRPAVRDDDVEYEGMCRCLTRRSTACQRSWQSCERHTSQPSHPTRC